MIRHQFSRSVLAEGGDWSGKRLQMLVSGG
jgi:hypothetical protein